MHARAASDSCRICMAIAALRRRGSSSTGLGTKWMTEADPPPGVGGQQQRGPRCAAIIAHQYKLALYATPTRVAPAPAPPRASYPRPWHSARIQSNAYLVEGPPCKL